MGRQVFITIQKINQKLLFFHSTLVCIGLLTIYAYFHGLASNNRFIYRNDFQNGVKLYQKCFLKTRFSAKKHKILCHSDNIILFKFHQHVVQIFFFFFEECL